MTAGLWSSTHTHQHALCCSTHQQTPLQKYERYETVHLSISIRHSCIASNKSIEHPIGQKLQQNYYKY